MKRTVAVPFGVLLLLVGLGWQQLTARAAPDEPPVAAPTAPDAPAVPQAPAVTVTGRYEVEDGQRVLTLWGTPRERGFAHGYLLAKQIVRGLEHDFEGVLKPLIPLYESVVRRGVVPKFAFAPRELEELEGLQAGLEARLSPEERVVAGLDRPFDLVDLKALNTFGDWYGLGCSSLAVWGTLTKDGRTLVGRNFDFPGFQLLLDHQHVVVRAADGAARGQVGVSHPGCIGTLTGMNTAGVFVAIHDVRIKPTLDKAMRPNVPRLVAVRRLLEGTAGPKACTQALALARSWPTLYGNNLMVVAPGAVEDAPRAAVLEYDGREDVDGGCTLRAVDAPEISEGERVPAVCLTCTNHHLCRPAPEGYRELYERWRFPLLSGVGMEPPPGGAFDVQRLLAHISRVAFPREGMQGRATTLRGPGRAHGTLHQAVGEPDAARLHVRMGAAGHHIRDAGLRAYDVKARVRNAAARR